MKVVVTGGAGFIGSHLVDRLVQLGCDTVVIDNLDKQVHPEGKRPSYLNKKAKFIKADVRSKRKVMIQLQTAHIVFHFAAAVGVAQSQYRIKHYVDANVGGTGRILDILANEKNQVRKIILASSMSCYGEGAYVCDNCGRVRPGLRDRGLLERGVWEPPCPKCGQAVRAVGVTEKDEFMCNSIYACTKMMQEEMVMTYAGTYQKPAVSLRFFNVYGTRQSLSNPYTGVAAIFISRIKNKNPPVIYEDGGQCRDFVSVYDIVDACILAMEKSEADFKCYNVGTGKPTSVLQLAQTLCSLMKFDQPPDILQKYRPGDIRHCFSNIDKIKNELGYTPRVSLEEGLKELILWSIKQKAVDRFEKAQRELVLKKLV